MTPRAALLACTVPLLLALVGCGEGDEVGGGPTPREAVATATAGAEPVEGWRTEWFRTIAVDVPEDWGWSQGAIRSVGDVVRCTDTRDDAPYVGRPVMASDLCMLVDDRAPEHGYLWFDAPLAPGAEDLGDGWVRETVVVDDVRITVAADEADLRARVLGSIREQDDCAPDLSEPPAGRFDTTTEGPGTLLSAVVCAYRVLDEDRDAVPVLAYAAVPTEEQVREVWSRREAMAPGLCSPTRTSEVVVVETTTHDDFGTDDAAPLRQRVVGWLACPAERRTVAPVADRGVRATLLTYIGPMG